MESVPISYGIQRWPPTSSCSAPPLTNKHKEDNVRRVSVQTLWHTDVFFARRRSFTHRPFCTELFLHTDSYTDPVAHQPFLNRDPITHKLPSHQQLTEAPTDTFFTHRHIYTRTLLDTDPFTSRPFYTRSLLHTDAFTQRRTDTQTHLHRDTLTHRGFFTHKRSDTQTLSHTDTCTHRHIYKQTPLYTDLFLHTARPFYDRRFYTMTPFTHRPFSTQTLLHTDSLTHRHLYTEIHLHTDTVIKRHI